MLMLRSLRILLSSTLGNSHFSPTARGMVFSPAARSATRRWLWDVSGFENIPGIRLQMSLRHRSHPVLSASLALSPAVPTGGQCQGGLGALGRASVAPLQGLKLGASAAGDVPADATVPWLTPRCQSVPVPTVPSPGDLPTVTAASGMGTARDKQHKGCSHLVEELSDHL